MGQLRPLISLIVAATFSAMALAVPREKAAASRQAAVLAFRQPPNPQARPAEKRRRQSAAAWQAPRRLCRRRAARTAEAERATSGVVRVRSRHHVGYRGRDDVIQRSSSASRSSPSAHGHRPAVTWFVPIRLTATGRCEMVAANHETQYCCLRRCTRLHCPTGVRRTDDPWRTPAPGRAFGDPKPGSMTR